MLYDIKLKRTRVCVKVYICRQLLSHPSANALQYAIPKHIAFQFAASAVSDYLHFNEISPFALVLHPCSSFDAHLHLNRLVGSFFGGSALWIFLVEEDESPISHWLYWQRPI